MESIKFAIAIDNTDKRCENDCLTLRSKLSSATENVNVVLPHQAN